MKVRELRVGNLVQRLDGTFFQIVSSDFPLIEKTPNSLTPQPIPLTEEWLLRFGFELDDDYGDVKYYETPKVIKNNYGAGVCKNHEEWSFYWARNKEVVTLIYDEPHFQYVHQLQNLYFALTGEELTLKEA